MHNAWTQKGRKSLSSISSRAWFQGEMQPGPTRTTWHFAPVEQRQWLSPASRLTEIYAYTQPSPAARAVTDWLLCWLFLPGYALPVGNKTGRTCLMNTFVSTKLLLQDFPAQLLFKKVKHSSWCLKGNLPCPVLPSLGARSYWHTIQTQPAEQLTLLYAQTHLRVTIMTCTLWTCMHTLYPETTLLWSSEADFIVSPFYKASF